MGQFFSEVFFPSARPNPEEEVCTGGTTYYYPPKHGGPFFASHFIMGGEKFESPQPESFLFGDNADLNCLGPRPVSFPYPPPPANEPTKTLKTQINVRRDSVHFVPLPSATPTASPHPGEVEGELNLSKKYNVKFTFDSDVRCAITLHYFCHEEVHPHCLNYVSTKKELSSSTYIYNKGASQVFDQPSHIFNPSTCWAEIEDYTLNPELGFSLAIHCVALEGPEPRQSHATLALIEKNQDNSVVLKSIKQKIFVDGLCYFLQEIYGLENKALQAKHYSDEDVDDSGEECVVCLCDLRDTLILPCRHLCLCFACAESLRYQASNCPICRIPFRALLQIRAVQKVNQVTHPAVAAEPDLTQDGFPSGYKSVSLVEVLNGPVPSLTSPKKSKDKKKKKSKNKSRKSKTNSSKDEGQASGLTSPTIKNEHVSTISINYVNEYAADITDSSVSSPRNEDTDLEKVSTARTSVASSQESRSKLAKAGMAMAESLEDVSKDQIEQLEGGEGAPNDIATEDSDFADCHENFKGNGETNIGEDGNQEEKEYPDFNLPLSPRSWHSSRSSQRSSSSSSSSEQLLSHSSQVSIGSTKVVNVKPVDRKNSGNFSKEESSEC